MSKRQKSLTKIQIQELERLYEVNRKRGCVMSNKELKDHVWKMYHITIKDSRVRQLNKRLQRGKYPFPSSKANYEKVHAASKSRDVDLDKLF